jgi:hypothetical protein
MRALGADLPWRCSSTAAVSFRVYVLEAASTVPREGCVVEIRTNKADHRIHWYWYEKGKKCGLPVAVVLGV